MQRLGGLKEPSSFRDLSADEILRQKVLIGYSSLSAFWEVVVSRCREETNSGVSCELNESENWEAEQPAHFRGSGIREVRKALM